MPLLKLCAPATLTEAATSELLLAASKLIAEATGKPEDYVMVTLDKTAACMAGTTAPTVCAEVKAIGGLTPKVNREISQRLCALCEKVLHVPAARVYITFTEVPASNWGWNGKTFG